MHEIVAVVDDEPDILELVSLHLRNNHFKCGSSPTVQLYQVSQFLNTRPLVLILCSPTPTASNFKYMKRKKIYHIFLLSCSQQKAKRQTQSSTELGPILR